ncbi:hypothetical protein [Winogradskyella sp.]|uniref:M61 family metallopeptidase n=1 Tax=Winogradskyella sp. TaxID=1883156 RepID=UPI00260CACD4|nr:hypothetical protein [Winogradskyella sp.]
MKYPTLFTTLLLFTIFSSSLYSQNTYKVQINGLKSIHITADLKVNTNQIYMPVVSSRSDPNGPVSSVKNLKITANGNALQFSGLNTGKNYYQWEFDNSPNNENIKIEYDIILNHANQKWPFGLEEVSYTTEEGVMIIGRYLFIVPDFGYEKTYTIAFDIPNNWTVSVPWKVENNTISNLSSEDIRNNVFFMGSHIEEIIKMDDINIKLVVDKPIREHSKTIMDHLRPNILAMRDMFKDTPKGTYLMVFKEGEMQGGAFNDSHSMILEKPINKESSVLWGHGMVHETFHFWNGKSLIPADPKLEWFKEGITEYLAMYLGRTTNTLSLKGYEKKMENAYRRYFLSTMLGEPMSLVDAGLNKDKNRFKIYGLGTVFAFILDGEIRYANKNKYGLGEVLRLMYNRIAKNDKTFTIDDVKATVNEVAGKDFSYLFDIYVYSQNPKDFNTSLNKFGLHLSVMYDEAYLIGSNCDELGREIKASLLSTSN